MTGAGASDRRRTHGATNTPEFRTWADMLDRCTNTESASYARYGGRGITVCQGWLESFENFIAAMGPRPSTSHSIDRRKNSLGYWCGACEECVRLDRSANCRWATATQQQRNTGANVLLTVGAETLTVAEWAERTGLSHSCILKRLHAGWPAEKIVSMPPTRGKGQRRLAVGIEPPTNKLTAKQARVLAFIREFLGEKGRAPNLPEMCARFGWASRTCAATYIAALLRCGAIAIDGRGHGRVIRIVEATAIEQPPLPLPSGAHPEPITSDFVHHARRLLEEHRGPLSFKEVEPLLREIAARHR